MIVVCCPIPGCNVRLHSVKGGRRPKYCSEEHRLLGQNGCIRCRKSAKFGNSEFCSKCDARTKSGGPKLVLIPSDNKAYSDIANQFRGSWRHPTTCPQVQAIYKIVTSKTVLDNYSAYRKWVEARGRFASKGLTPGNQRRRWHGTDRMCTIGDSGQTSLCPYAQCSLCCVIRSSFDIAHATKKTKWGRFGCGIYTSSTSSKSNDYSANYTPSNWKALLLTYVTAGKAAKYTKDEPSITQPPAGYDSVVGEPSPTGSLNYDELVVYRNDAACPAYLVMYSHP